MEGMEWRMTSTSENENSTLAGFTKGSMATPTDGESATLNFDVWGWTEVEVADRDEGLVCASVLHI